VIRGLLYRLHLLHSPSQHEILRCWCQKKERAEFEVSFERMCARLRARGVRL
jgi:hypothetical protein